MGPVVPQIPPPLHPVSVSQWICTDLSEHRESAEKFNPWVLYPCRWGVPKHCKTWLWTSGPGTSIPPSGGSEAPCKDYSAVFGPSNLGLAAVACGMFSCTHHLYDKTYPAVVTGTVLCEVYIPSCLKKLH